MGIFGFAHPAGVWQVVLVNKETLVQEIIAVLATQMDAYTRAARDAYAAATDPGSRAENKYDTRSLESSYLARGQAIRVAETEESLVTYRSMRCRPFGEEEPAALGALVQLSGPEGNSFYFLGPSAGGTEVMHEGSEVLVITPSSPLGQLLVGKKKGQEILMPGARAPQKSKVVAVV
ncbi:hypothetical protein [Verrucomicrobium sp. BvORR106]|uniref:hypothetical protein n=1 Tax=Verrucomicrobium sp. BvORR106 TaxID=1403819 RepID=UPI002240F51D|nr:hypothetical protein [Verrucomicrobium sp. BvORR106]